MHNVPQHSRRLRAPALAAVSIVLIIVGALLYKQRSAHETPTIEPSAESIADIAPTSSEPPAPRSAASMTPAARQAIAGIVAARGQTKTAASRDSAGLRVAATQAYAAEVRDDAWATSKENELSKVATGPGMTAAGVKADGLSMQCKRTLCETTATFATTGAAEDWVLAYMSSMGSAASNSVVSRDPMADGGTRITIISTAR